MLQRSAIAALLLLFAFVLYSCEDDPTGSNGVPNSITGKVWLLNGDTVDKPLDEHSGVTVAIKGTSFTAVTNAAGEYTINNVPPGVYVLTFAKPDFDSTKTTVEYSGVGVEFVQTVSLRRFMRIHRIEGMVTPVLFGDTLKDLSGTKIEILGTSLSTTTDSEGKYMFSDVAAGSYIVQATRPGFDTATKDLTYSGKGVVYLSPMYLYSKSFISIAGLLSSAGEHLTWVFEGYSDSVRGDVVWVGGKQLSKSGRYIIAFGGAVNVAYNAIQFELADNDPSTEDPVIPELASTEKMQYIKYYDYDAIQALLNGALAGRSVNGRMKGFSTSLNMEIHSNRMSIPF